MAKQEKTKRSWKWCCFLLGIIKTERYAATSETIK
jgi:hypothetical protein